MDQEFNKPNNQEPIQEQLDLSSEYFDRITPKTTSNTTDDNCLKLKIIDFYKKNKYLVLILAVIIVLLFVFFIKQTFSSSNVSPEYAITQQEMEEKLDINDNNILMQDDIVNTNRDESKIETENEVHVNKPTSSNDLGQETPVMAEPSNNTTQDKTNRAAQIKKNKATTNKKTATTKSKSMTIVINQGSTLMQEFRNKGLNIADVNLMNKTANNKVFNKFKPGDKVIIDLDKNNRVITMKLKNGSYFVRQSNGSYKYFPK